MAFYTNLSKDSPIATLEFSPTIDGNFSFFGVRNAVDLPSVKEQLTSLGQKIIAETTVNGRPMLVTRGKRTDYNLLDSLTERGNNFKAPQPNKKLDMWKLRGVASMIGQPLQILSAWLKPKGLDMGIFGFASLNMIANIANYVFGAEESTDTNQLRFLKRKFNYEISKYLPDGATSLLPSSYDDRIHLRAGKEKPPGLGTKFYDFLRRHSVSFCEIGLRYVGSILLIFPNDMWRKGFGAFGTSKKGFGGAALDGAAAALNADRLSAKAGMAYVGGKTLAFTSKVPDPYDPKPHTKLDTFREKIVFPLSSAIEAVAAGIIAYNGLFIRRASYNKLAAKLEPLVQRFKLADSHWLSRWVSKYGEMKWIEKEVNGVKQFDKAGKIIKEHVAVHTTADYASGIGGALFTSGLIMRIFAPFGKRTVDLKELHAHIVDGLAQIPPDKLPSVIANFASFLTEHFKGQVEFGEVYKELSDGLYRHHGIPLPNIGVLTPEADLQKAALQAAKTEEPAKRALDTIERDIETVEEKEKGKSSKYVPSLAANDTAANSNENPTPDSQDKTFAQESMKSSKDILASKAAQLSHTQRAAANDSGERIASIN